MYVQKEILVLETFLVLFEGRLAVYIGVVVTSNVRYVKFLFGLYLCIYLCVCDPSGVHHELHNLVNYIHVLIQCALCS